MTTTTATNVGAADALGPQAYVERLRGLVDTDVTITTHEGSITGSVLSCTRLSVWLIVDDADHVICVDDIIDVVSAHDLAA